MDHWCNQLSPYTNDGPFTAAEDEQILGLSRSIGKKWSMIARAIPGRT
jgi:myb proto-oncogene protein